MWEIIRNVYLGDRRDARDRHLLHTAGITHIVNCAAELPCSFPRDFTYLHVELSDPDPEFHAQIEPVCRFIHRGRRKGAVMVHCRSGVNRGASVILAYMCWRGRRLKAALDLLRKRVGESDCEFIEPDSSFLEQIEVFFDE